MELPYLVKDTMSDQQITTQNASNVSLSFEGAHAQNEPPMLLSLPTDRDATFDRQLIKNT